LNRKNLLKALPVFKENLTMKKKIYHYSYDSLKNPYCGGGGAYRDQYIHKLLAERYDVTFFVGYYKGAKNYSVDGIDVRTLGFGNHLLSRITFFICATIHGVFSRADINVIAFSVFSPVLSFLFRPKSTVIVIHHVLGTMVFKKYGIAGIFPYIFEWCLLKFNDNFITSAKSVAAKINKISNRKHATAVFNGYDESLLVKNKIEDKYILSFGRIDVFMKGQDLLIKAFEKLSPSVPDYTLIIAGKGKKRDVEAVRTMVGESVVKGNIQYITKVSDEQKRELLSRATLVVIPSRFEGWCIVAIEAAASSKPIVGTKIEGLIDTIQDGVNGILVPSEDIDALASAMQKLLLDNNLRKKMSAESYQWAQTFSWEDTAKRQEQYYKEFMERNVRKR
jgi:glycosyltransferase involved in cell wall biosynthesis